MDPLTSGLGGKAQCAQGLEQQQQQATLHEASAREEPHGSGRAGSSSQHSAGGQWGPGLINPVARRPPLTWGRLPEAPSPLGGRGPG